MEALPVRGHAFLEELTVFLACEASVSYQCELDLIFKEKEKWLRKKTKFLEVRKNMVNLGQCKWLSMVGIESIHGDWWELSVNYVHYVEWKEVKGQPAMQYKLVNEQQYENQKGYDTMIFVIASWPLLLVVKEI